MRSDDVTFIARRIDRLCENETDHQLALRDLADEIERREARLVEEPYALDDLAEEIEIRAAQLGPLLSHLRAIRREIALAESLAAMLADDLAP
jgi:hypothetical protein